MTNHIGVNVEKILSEFPIEARINTRKVAAMGMAISSVEIEGWKYLCWQGSNELFSKTGVFSAKLDFVNIKRCKYVYPWGLRGDLKRQANGDLKFFIGCCYLESRPIAYMRIAKNDEAFNRFKKKCFVPIENLKAEIDSN